ncbi:MAG: hypothetical protein M0Z30_18690 [Actinomycetota bacterium]|nr:hypothetical protein [Actinomycetota bacterium]
MSPTFNGAPDAPAPLVTELPVDALLPAVVLLDEAGLVLDEQAATAATRASTPAARAYR